MPMTIAFCEDAIKTLISPPPPARPLQDIILSLDYSNEFCFLAATGRNILRSCIMARNYKPPINLNFELEIDEKMGEHELAKIARSSTLLERLKVDKVANDLAAPDMARILLAYLGATFASSLKQNGTNIVHNSINDICSMILQDDDLTVVENGSHERMLNLPNVVPISTPVKNEPAPSLFSSTRPTSSAGTALFDDNRSMDSFSSGRSPPPLLYGAHYHQSYQPYYPPNPSNPHILHPHISPLHNPTISSRFSSYAPGTVHTSSPATFAQPQPQFASPSPQIPPQPTYHAQPPPSAMPSGGYPGMGMAPNPPGFAPPPQAPPIPQVMSQQTQGFISLVNELAMKHRKLLTWQQTKVGQQHMPEWTMWLSVDGQLRGQGTAPTKQAAKEIASKAALLSMGWIQG